MKNSQFYVVELSNDGGLAVIPSNWFYNDKKSTFWTITKNPISLIKRRASVQDDWESFDVHRIFGSTGIYLNNIVIPNIEQFFNFCGILIASHI